MTLPGDYISQLHEVVWPVCKHQTNFLYMIKVARPFGPRGRPGGGIQRGCCPNNCWGRRDPQRPWCQFNRLKKRLKTRLKNHLIFKFDFMAWLNYHFWSFPSIRNLKWFFKRFFKRFFSQLNCHPSDEGTHITWQMAYGKQWISISNVLDEGGGGFQSVFICSPMPYANSPNSITKVSSSKIPREDFRLLWPSRLIVCISVLIWWTPA